MVIDFRCSPERLEVVLIHFQFRENMATALFLLLAASGLIRSNCFIAKSASSSVCHAIGDYSSGEDLEHFPMHKGVPLPRGSLRMAATSVVNGTSTSKKVLQTDLEVAEAKLEILQGVVLELKADKDSAVAEWKQKTVKAESARKDSLKSIKNLEKELSEAKMKWWGDKQQFEKKVENLLAERGVEGERTAKEIQKRKDSETRLRHKINSMQGEIDQMDGEVLSLKNIRDDLATKLRDSQENEAQVLAKEREKTTNLREELRSIRRERDDALDLLDEMKKSQEANDEAIEIARSSVAAAERREAAVKSQYSDLRSEYEFTKAAMNELEENIQSLKADNARLIAELEAVTTQNTGRSEVEVELEQEVEALNDQIVSLKQVHGAKLRAEQRAADKRLAEMQEKYHQQMQQVRMAAIGTKVGSDQKRGIRKRISSLFRKN